MITGLHCRCPRYDDDALHATYGYLRLPTTFTHRAATARGWEACGRTLLPDALLNRLLCYVDGGDHASGSDDLR